MKRLVVKAMVVIMLTVVGCSAIGGTRETEAASNKGQKVVNYAKRFVGNKYRYGGTSLTRGAGALFRICNVCLQKIRKKTSALFLRNEKSRKESKRRNQEGEAGRHHLLQRTRSNLYGKK